MHDMLKRKNYGQCSVSELLCTSHCRNISGSVKWTHRDTHSSCSQFMLILHNVSWYLSSRRARFDLRLKTFVVQWITQFHCVVIWLTCQQDQMIYQEGNPIVLNSQDIFECQTCFMHQFIVEMFIYVKGKTQNARCQLVNISWCKLTETRIRIRKTFFVLYFFWCRLKDIQCLFTINIKTQCLLVGKDPTNIIVNGNPWSLTVC